MKAWRASGQRADDFCVGLGCTAGLLRHWAWRLGMTRKRGGHAGVAPRVRLARVVRTGAPDRARGYQEGIRIAIGRAWIEVPAGVDVATLAAVVAVLERRQDATEEQS